MSDYICALLYGNCGDEILRNLTQRDNEVTQIRKRTVEIREPAQKKSQISTRILLNKTPEHILKQFNLIKKFILSNSNFIDLKSETNFNNLSEENLFKMKSRSVINPTYSKTTNDSNFWLLISIDHLHFNSTHQYKHGIEGNFYLKQK